MIALCQAKFWRRVGRRGRERRAAARHPFERSPLAMNENTSFNSIFCFCDRCRAKRLAKYAAELGAHGPSPDCKQVSDGLERVVYVPCCSACGSTEEVVDGRCRLCAIEDASNRKRYERDNDINKLVERSAFLQKRRRTGPRRRGGYAK